MSTLTTLKVSGEDVPVEVTRNPRAKRLQFRLDARTGNVRLTLPPGISLDRGLRFVQDKADWIRPRRAKILANSQPLIQGTEIPVNGHLLPVTYGPKPALDPDRLVVRSSCPGDDLSRLLKALAKRTIPPLAHAKADQLGRPIARLTLRDTKSRWGSCTSGGALSFNWRIMCADPLLQDYLVAHEVAHLKEPHHQPPFWAQCARLMAQPQSMQAARAKLKAISPKLMALPLGS